MARALDLADIQGNILRSYGMPKARFLFLHIDDEAAGRRFVEAISSRITTAVRWVDKGDRSQSRRRHKSEARHTYPDTKVTIEKPKVTFNISFTFMGLFALGLPTSTLKDFPSEFIDGMGARAHILGDDFPPGAGRAKWDAIWRESDGAGRVHMLVSLNAQMKPDGSPVAELEAATRWVFEQCAKGGVRVLAGHGPAKSRHQDVSALLAPLPDGSMVPMPKEHFGFTDGFGDPVFDGQYPSETEMAAAIGSGKIEPDQSWKPLATGEFLLGYPDEAQETPPAAMPFAFTRNGTFMAYRKLHENVDAFRAFVTRSASLYTAVNTSISAGQACEIVMSKIVGRWSNGVPLEAAPTYAAWQAFNQREAAARAAKSAPEIAAIEQEYVDFKYRTDPAGSKCPMTAHMRRANPRDMLDPTGQSPNPKDWHGSVLNNRRRILRRGLPYGPTTLGAPAPDGEQGIVFIAVCASLFRQFEFVQQQWIQYGLDFGAGNDTCPMLGNHGAGAKFVIPGDATAGLQPVICADIPQMVEVRGGDYFFIPSMTALRMLAMGIIDPT